MKQRLNEWDREGWTTLDYLAIYVTLPAIIGGLAWAISLRF